MNETLKTILSRRSIRRFEQGQIQETELQLILEAGKYAPSAMNQQPWHFTVIQRKETLIKINEVCKEILIKSGNQSFKERAKGANVESLNLIYNAPTLIIVSGDEKAIAPQIDCCLALENMFLAAESMGVGSCWIHAIKHMFATEGGKAFLFKELSIPDGFVIVGIGAFGYKAGEVTLPSPRREGTITMIR